MEEKPKSPGGEKQRGRYENTRMGGPNLACMPDGSAYGRSASGRLATAMRREEGA